VLAANRSVGAGIQGRTAADLQGSTYDEPVLKTSPPTAP
jgi:hypothetical protein